MTIKGGPTFFPSISNDTDTWFWRGGIKARGLLIAVDVLAKVGAQRRRHGRVNKILGFKGKVVLDNGAFGRSKATDPLAMLLQQKQAKPAIAIVLDAIATRARTPAGERASVMTTVSNARQV